MRSVPMAEGRRYRILPAVIIVGALIFLYKTSGFFSHKGGAKMDDPISESSNCLLTTWVIVDTILALSVWLMPAQPVMQKLQTMMDDHPSGHPLSYPHFQPHITLASVARSTPLKAVTAAIPTDQFAIPVKFEALKTSDTFFRSVLVSIQHHPALSALHDTIYNNLGVKANTVMFPHMSLFYIDDSEREERKRLADALKHDGKVKNVADGVALKCQNEWFDGFDGVEIWIVDSDAPVEKWKVLEKIRLPL